MGGCVSIWEEDYRSPSYDLSSTETIFVGAVTLLLYTSVLRGQQHSPLVQEDLVLQNHQVNICRGPDVLVDEDGNPVPVDEDGKPVDADGNPLELPEDFITRKKRTYELISLGDLRQKFYSLAQNFEKLTNGGGALTVLNCYDLRRYPHCVSVKNYTEGGVSLVHDKDSVQGALMEESGGYNFQRDISKSSGSPTSARGPPGGSSPGRDDRRRGAGARAATSVAAATSEVSAFGSFLEIVDQGPGGSLEELSKTTGFLKIGSGTAVSSSAVPGRATSIGDLSLLGESGQIDTTRHKNWSAGVLYLNSASCRNPSAALGMILSRPKTLRILGVSPSSLSGGFLENILKPLADRFTHFMSRTVEIVAATDAFAHDKRTTFPDSLTYAACDEALKKMNIFDRVLFPPVEVDSGGENSAEELLDGPITGSATGKKQEKKVDGGSEDAAAEETVQKPSPHVTAAMQMLYRYHSSIWVENFRQPSSSTGRRWSIRRCARACGVVRSVATCM